MSRKYSVFPSTGTDFPRQALYGRLKEKNRYKRDYLPTIIILLYVILLKPHCNESLFV